jgi:signal peptidase II
MHPILRKWLPLFTVTGFIIALDQISKAWIVNNLNIGETILPIPALFPYFQFTRSTNTGFAFGIAEGGSSIILLVNIIIVLVLLYTYTRSAAKANLQHIALALVVGGALGNIIDRIQHGYVVDFFHIVIPNLISNVSNFADHAVVLGVIILLIDSYLEERREKRKLAETETIAQDSSQNLDEKTG